MEYWNFVIAKGSCLAGEQWIQFAWEKQAQAFSKSSPVTYLLTHFEGFVK